MFSARPWIVCERSGRWAAALRTAFARSPDAQAAPRVREVRTLAELSKDLHDQGCNFALVEVGPANLTEVLQLLVRRGPRAAPLVALVEDGADQAISDLLREMGAVDVVESPRRLGRLLALHGRLAARGPVTANFVDRQSFSKWAWSTLPWQDS